jgi:hypothetical protein
MTTTSNVFFEMMFFGDIHCTVWTIIFSEKINPVNLAGKLGIQKIS